MVAHSVKVHRTDVYVFAYALFASGLVAASALVVLTSLGVGPERSASGLLAFGTISIVVLRPWERGGVGSSPAVHTYVDTAAPPTRLVSSADSVDPWVVCFGLILWGVVALAFV